MYHTQSIRQPDNHRFSPLQACQGLNHLNFGNPNIVAYFELFLVPVAIRPGACGLDGLGIRYQALAPV